MPIALRDFVAVDLETNGLDSEGGEIVEIGAVRVADGRPAETFSRMIRGAQPLSAMVRRLTGIDEAMRAAGDEPARALADFAAFAGDLPLVAHNSDFDLAFLDAARAKAGLPPVANPVLDSLLLARIAWPEWPNHRLESLVERLGLEAKPAHRALPDAEQAAAVFLRAQARLAEYPDHALGRLRRALEPGPSPWLLLFGGAGEAGPAPMPPDAPAAAPAAAPRPEAAAWFAPGGPLAQSLSGYVPRPGQAYLAGQVAAAFAQSRFLCAEAPAGTGQVLACLLPAALHALRQGGPVAVAVAGRAPAERELDGAPSALAAALGPELRLAELAEPESYLCAARLERALEHPEIWLAEEERAALLPVITWASSTRTGDIRECCGFSRERHRALWAKLRADGLAATGRMEPYRDGEWAARAQRRAARAHLVFIPRRLLLSRLELDLAGLPAFERLVVPEAHKLREEAPLALGREIGFFRLRNQLQALSRGKGEARGLLAATAAKAGLPAADLEALAEAAREPERQLQKFLARLAKHARKRRQEDGAKLRFAAKLALEFNAPPEPVLEALAALSGRLEALARELAARSAGDPGGESLAAEVRAAAGGVDEFRRDLAHICEAARPDEVYWMEEVGNPHKALLRSAPAACGPALAERLYPLLATAVFCSPCIAFNDQFQYFQQALGLDAVEPSRRVGRLVRGGPEPKARPAAPEAGVAETAAPADLAMFLPRLGPAPGPGKGQPPVGESLARALGELGRGSVIIFTGLHALRQSRELLLRTWGAEGRAVLAQHIDGNRDNLLNLFRRWGGACLLGTEGLLEAPEAPPAGLDLLVVHKLPFPAPSEPLVARALEDLRERGQNGLLDYLVPEAVLKLKQILAAFARGPRRRRAVWLLDPRPLTERYGRAFTRLWAHAQAVPADGRELAGATLAFLDTGALPRAEAAAPPAHDAAPRHGAHPKHRRGGRPGSPGPRPGPEAAPAPVPGSGSEPAPPAEAAMESRPEPESEPQLGPQP